MFWERNDSRDAICFAQNAADPNLPFLVSHNFAISARSLPVSLWSLEKSSVQLKEDRATLNAELIIVKLSVGNTVVQGTTVSFLVALLPRRLLELVVAKMGFAVVGRSYGAGD